MQKNRTLDIYQNSAVYTEEKNVLVVAAPGSGKTTVIINRAAHLIQSRKVSPDNMVVITFTRAAAVNMKDRYLKLTNNSRAPFFGTIHALFYKILSRHEGNINIISGSDAFKIVNGVLVSYLDSVGEDKVKEVLNDISLFKNSGESIEYYKPKIDKSIFVDCLKNYENYKVENRLMDFDDLQIRAKELFLNNPQLLTAYKNMFKYILVDEFQDCDRVQIELLQMLSSGNSIFAVGDEDQCIYGFRGSRPDCMVEFENYFENGKKIYLKMNYRSRENIVGLSKLLIANNKIRNPKEIEANKRTEGKIRFFNLADEKRQSIKIAEAVDELIKQEDSKYSDCAVLYRTNLESRSLIDVFLKKGIPFKLLDKEYDFFNHFVCKDIIAYLNLSLDISDKESFVRIINKPFRYVSKVNVEKVRRNIIKESCFETLMDIEDIPIYQLKAMEKLEKDILKLKRMFLRDAINFIVDDLGYFNYLYEYSQRMKSDFEELKDVLESFKEAAEDFNSITTFLVHISEFKQQLSSKYKDEDSVILSTIHGVKGMEFKNVFIVNCNEGVIPHNNSLEGNIEEERRLFYVAATRAIDNLNMFSTRMLKGKSKEISRFIGECGIGYQEVNTSEAAITGEYKSGEKIEHKAFGRGRIVAVEGRNVSIEFGNGIVRKFDIVVLESSDLMVKVC